MIVSWEVLLHQPLIPGDPDCSDDKCTFNLLLVDLPAALEHPDVVPVQRVEGWWRHSLVFLSTISRTGWSDDPSVCCQEHSELHPSQSASLMVFPLQSLPHFYCFEEKGSLLCRLRTKLWIVEPPWCKQDCDGASARINSSAPNLWHQLTLSNIGFGVNQNILEIFLHCWGNFYYWPMI